MDPAASPPYLPAMLSEQAAAQHAPGETEDPSSLDLRPETTALFLDCDGTLAEIVDRPADAFVPPATLALVARLHACLGGALAIVSGRSLADIDRMFAPHLLPAAGTHGMERRDGGGRLHAPPVDAGVLADAARSLGRLVRGQDGLLVERKPSAIALHYRLRPELGQACLDAATAVAARHPALRLRPGKAVIELGLGDKTKADAIVEFMAERPFAGRVPVFVGDDLTDEDGFAAVASLGGHGIKVGTGVTAAHLRVADSRAVRKWLAALAASWKEKRDH